MIAAHHVIFVPLIPPDAIAAMKLRAALDEICARNDAFAVESGPSTRSSCMAAANCRWSRWSII